MKNNKLSEKIKEYFFGTTSCNALDYERQFWAENLPVKEDAKRVNKSLGFSCFVSRYLGKVVPNILLGVAAYRALALNDENFWKTLACGEVLRIAGIAHTTKLLNYSRERKKHLIDINNILNGGLEEKLD